MSIDNNDEWILRLPPHMVNESSSRTAMFHTNIPPEYLPKETVPPTLRSLDEILGAPLPEGTKIKFNEEYRFPRLFVDPDPEATPDPKKQFLIRGLPFVRQTQIPSRQQGKRFYEFKGVIDSITHEDTSSVDVKSDSIRDKILKKSHLWAVSPIQNDEDLQKCMFGLSEFQTKLHPTESDLQLIAEFEKAISTYMTTRSYSRSVPTKLGGYLDIPPRPMGLVPRQYLDGLFPVVKIDADSFPDINTEGPLSLQELIDSSRKRVTAGNVRNLMNMIINIQEAYPTKAATGFVDVPPVWSGVTKESITVKYSDDSLKQKLRENTQHELRILDDLDETSLSSASRSESLSAWLRSVHGHNTFPEIDSFTEISNGGTSATPTTHHHKENIMTQINVSALAGLVAISKKDDLTDFLTPGLLMNDELKAALVEAEQDDRKNAVKEAAQSIRSLIHTVSMVKEARVVQIRQVRATEKNLLDELKQIERAQQYAAETSNYLPLLFLADPNFINSMAYGRLSSEVAKKVPEDWLPAVTSLVTSNVSGSEPPDEQA